MIAKLRRLLISCRGALCDSSGSSDAASCNDDGQRQAGLKAAGATNEYACCNNNNGAINSPQAVRQAFIHWKDGGGNCSWMSGQISATHFPPSTSHTAHDRASATLFFHVPHIYTETVRLASKASMTVLTFSMSTVSSSNAQPLCLGPLRS